LVDITESNDTLTMPHCIQASCLDESASDDCFQVFWSTEEFFCPFSDTESCESIKVLEKRENHFGIPDCLMFLSWSNLQGSPELSYASAKGILEHPGKNCSRWQEPNDPHTWHDNYMCILQTSPFEILFVNGEHILITDVEDHGFTQNDCVNLNRPFQKAEETWFDNYFCIKKLKTDGGD